MKKRVCDSASDLRRQILPQSINKHHSLSPCLLDLLDEEAPYSLPLAYLPIRSRALRIRILRFIETKPKLLNKKGFVLSVTNASIFACPNRAPIPGSWLRAEKGLDCERRHVPSAPPPTHSQKKETTALIQEHFHTRARWKLPCS